MKIKMKTKMKERMTRVTKSGQVDKRLAPMMSRTVSWETFVRRLSTKIVPNKDRDRRFYSGFGFCMQCGRGMNTTEFVHNMVNNPDHVEDTSVLCYLSLIHI